MRETILEYARYNIWANKSIINTMSGLSAEETTQEITGSFPSIRKTVTHIWFAEKIWLQRLLMEDRIVIPEDDGSMTFTELCQQCLNTSGALLAFAEKLYDDRALQHEFIYQNIKGEPFKNSVWQCLHHVFNHSTFHRGQLVIYLRQLGKTKIPSTDFITYTRR